MLLLFEESEGSRTWALPGEIAGLVGLPLQPLSHQEGLYYLECKMIDNLGTKLVNNLKTGTY